MTPSDHISYIEQILNSYEDIIPESDIDEILEQVYALRDIINTLSKVIYDTSEEFKSVLKDL